jgi:FkbM family methyltransferase
LNQFQQRVYLTRYKAKEAIKARLTSLGINIRRKRPELDELQFLSKLKIRTVLDIGANTGQFATQARQLLPEAVIHCFDPVREAYNSLSRLAAKDPRMFAYNVALGEEEKDVVMEVNEYTPSSSILHMAPAHLRAFPFTAHTKPERVRMIRLDTWASEAQIEPPLLVKLDVQGYEDRVLRGGTNTVRKAAVILTEVSFCELYEGQVLYDELYSTIRALGFRSAGMIQNLRDSTSRILSCDAIFVSPDTFSINWKLNKPAPANQPAGV